MKHCPRCGRDLPIEAFRRPSTRRCKSCEEGPPPTARTSTFRPAHSLTVALLTDHAEALRGVRVGLEEARRRGLAFNPAWSTVVEVALDELPADDQQEWLAALDETRGAWKTAYGDAGLQQAA